MDDIAIDDDVLFDLLPSLSACCTCGYNAYGACNWNDDLLFSSEMNNAV